MFSITVPKVRYKKIVPKVLTNETKCDNITIVKVTMITFNTKTKPKGTKTNDL